MPGILIERDDIDLKPNSAVSEVVIFSDKALVKRILKCKLTKGENVILFKNLGMDIIEDSIKAKTSGTDMRIVSTGIKINNLYFFKSEDNDRLYDELIDNLKNLIRISDVKKVNLVCSGIINDLRRYIGLMQNNIILEKEVSIFKLKESLTFLDAVLKENTAKNLDLDFGYAKLGEVIDILNGKIERIKQLDRKLQSVIEIVLSSETETESSIEISYVLPNVRWSAVYDSILDTKESEIDFHYFGSIAQWTGEDWIDAKISLSTAAVEDTMQIPQVYPVYIESVYQKRDKELVLDNKSIKDGFDDAASSDEVPESEVPDKEMKSEKKMVSHNFVIDKLVSIPSDGNSHKVLIMNKRIKCELYNETIPELMPHVYLKASFVNDTSFPFLPGINSIYRNGSYMGRSNVKYISDKEKVEISFGIEDDIRVKRIVTRNQYQRSKNILERNIWEKENKFIFNNYSGTKKKVMLKEGIYVSELNEVTVIVKPETSQGYKADKEGIVSWDVDLTDDPLVITEITLSYKMESQRNFDMNDFS